MGSIASNKLVGLLYSVVIFATMAVPAGALHMIAPGSGADHFVQVHFDMIVYVTLGAFVTYMLARGFWDAFWDTGNSKSGPQD